ncbi:hypothetical protein C1646_765187 [Rhizophagus diaphanus]|nr:hypothetical protein C1646_765187 [Rhizophagus diaphanus] [Rhizophagus sp. MUCL 43196]
MIETAVGTSLKEEREMMKIPDTQTPQSANISTPLTPPDRIYMELANIPVKKYKKTTPLIEELRPLKQDNIVPEEVIEPHKGLSCGQKDRTDGEKESYKNRLWARGRGRDDKIKRPEPTKEKDETLVQEVSWSRQQEWKKERERRAKSRKNKKRGFYSFHTL